jgi:hypothetical protein
MIVRGPKRDGPLQRSVRGLRLPARGLVGIVGIVGIVTRTLHGDG